MESITNSIDHVFEKITSLNANDWRALAVLFGLGVIVSVVMAMITPRLQKRFSDRHELYKNMAHLTLVVLAFVSTFGDYMVHLSGVQGYLPARAAAVFLSAVTFWNLRGRVWVSKAQQFVKDAETGRTLRVPTPDAAVEEFSQSHS